MKPEIAGQLRTATDEAARRAIVAEICQAYGQVRSILFFADEENGSGMTCLVSMADRSSLWALQRGTGAPTFGFDSVVFRFERSAALSAA